jgi:hypothetical protein
MGSVIISGCPEPLANQIYVEGATYDQVSLTDCQNYCRNTPSCTFYTWNSDNFGNATPHYKKRFAVFASPDGMSLTKLPLTGNNLIIPGQGEFVSK